MFEGDIGKTAAMSVSENYQLVASQAVQSTHLQLYRKGSTP